MSCEDITKAEVENVQPILVYYGLSETSIQPGGPMAHYRKLAAKDAIIYWRDPIKFAVNFDEECKKSRNLSKDKESFVLYVHPQEFPFVLEDIAGDQIAERKLRHWVSVSLSEFKLQWSQRALAVMFEYHSSALVYMPQYRTPEDSTDEATYIQQLVIAASRMIREKRSSLLVLMSDSIPEEPTRNLKTGTPSLQETFEFEIPK